MPGGGMGDRLARGVTFWGMVGAVMTAMKLKERYDDCTFPFSKFPLQSTPTLENSIATRYGP